LGDTIPDRQQKGGSMTISMVPLLLVDEAVPPRARAELLAATVASDAERALHLEAAARVLYDEAHLPCADARELVGLAD
jgi:hypothetical protein